jgi:hypothetical protein
LLDGLRSDAPSEAMRSSKGGAMNLRSWLPFAVYLCVAVTVIDYGPWSLSWNWRTAAAVAAGALLMELVLSRVRGSKPAQKAGN